MLRRIDRSQQDGAIEVPICESVDEMDLDRAEAEGRSTWQLTDDLDVLNGRSCVQNGT